MIQGHSSDIRCLRLWESNDRNLLLSSSKNGKILIFNIENERAQLYQSLEQNGDIRCLNIFRFGIISSVHHGKATKWKFSNDSKLFKFDDFSKFDFCCFDLDKSFAISEDGLFLFGMNDQRKTRILVEDFNSEEDARELEGHSDIITAILYDSKQQKLYSSGKDKSIIKWDIANFLKNKQNIPIDQTGKMELQNRDIHSGDIFTLEALCDFKFILSGGKDKQVKLVETKSLIVLGSFDAGMSIYGIIGNGKLAYFFGKNSKKIGKWDLQSYFWKEEEAESPQRVENKMKKHLSLTIKSCVVGKQEIKVDRFFNKSTSLTRSKIIFENKKD